MGMTPNIPTIISNTGQFVLDAGLRKLLLAIIEKINKHCPDGILVHLVEDTPYFHANSRSSRLYEKLLLTQEVGSDVSACVSAVPVDTLLEDETLTTISADIDWYIDVANGVRQKEGLPTASKEELKDVINAHDTDTFNLVPLFALAVASPDKKDVIVPLLLIELYLEPSEGELPMHIGAQCAYRENYSGTGLLLDSVDVTSYPVGCDTSKVITATC